jgi:DNA-binding MarR family transcriptional regulator
VDRLEVDVTPEARAYIVATVLWHLQKHAKANVPVLAQLSGYHPTDVEATVQHMRRIGQLCYARPPRKRKADVYALTDTGKCAAGRVDPARVRHAITTEVR